MSALVWKDYDEWVGSPAGAYMLTVAARCDTYKEGNAVLKAAFEAARATQPRSTSAYMDSPHYRVNKFVAAMRVMRPNIDRLDRIGPFELAMADLEAVIRDTADYYRDNITEGGSNATKA